MVESATDSPLWRLIANHYPRMLSLKNGWSVKVKLDSRPKIGPAKSWAVRFHHGSAGIVVSLRAARADPTAASCSNSRGVRRSYEGG